MLLSDKFKVEFQEGDWDCSNTEVFEIVDNDELYACSENLLADEVPIETCSDYEPSEDDSSTDGSN